MGEWPHEKKMKMERKKGENRINKRVKLNIFAYKPLKLKSLN